MTGNRYAHRAGGFFMPPSKHQHHTRGHEPPPLRYAGGSMTNLTDASDDVLDASLDQLYAQHEAATDPQARAEIHWAISQILGEQSRRLDAWISERTTA